MANFFLDNEDIQFLFNHIDLAELARIQEDDFVARRPTIRRTTRPRDAADAVDNYRRVLEIIGEVAGEMIAPNAEQVDHEGNTLNEDGTVTLHPLVQENLDRLDPGRPDGLHAAAQVRRAELPQPHLHDGHRDDQPGRHAR